MDTHEGFSRDAKAQVSRRAALTAASLTAVGILVSPRPAVARPANGLANGATNEVVVSPLEGRDVLATQLTQSTGEVAQAVAVPSLLGAKLQTSSGLPVGTTVALRWDGRVYEPVDIPVVRVNGKAAPAITAGAITQIAPHTFQQTLRIDSAIDRGTQLDILAGRTKEGDPAATTAVLEQSPLTQITIDEASGSRLFDGSISEAFDANETWGAAVSVAWRDVPVGDLWTRLPELVTVSALGPADVPAGLRVSMTVDAASLRGMPVVTPLIDGPEESALRVSRLNRTGNVVSFGWTCPSLRAGSYYSMHVGSEVKRGSSGRPTTFEAPRISLSPPSSTSNARRQRSTGNESVGLPEGLFTAEGASIPLG